MYRGAFLRCRGLTDVTLSEGLQTIGERAFELCKSLVSVNFPSTLKVIGRWAFENCERLCTLNLPDSIDTIKDRAFDNCILQNLRIPPLVTDVDTSMIKKCECLVSLELSENVRTIKGGYHDPTIYVRNIALPSDYCVEVALTNCDSLRSIFPEDEDGRTASEALKQRFDNLPIHKICYYQSYHDKETVMKSLSREVSMHTGQLNATGKQQDCLGMTPLHIAACSTRQDIEVYRLLIGKYPETLISTDKWGDIPLLYAFWCNAPDEVVELLVDSYKSHHPEYEFDWKGMLLTLVKAHVPLANIQKLVSTQQNSFPDQCYDMQSTVLELAELDAKEYRHRTPNETFRYLLGTSVAKRLDTLNVARWRLELESRINNFPAGQVGDRRANANKLYEMVAEYESAKEATSILELALWKLKIDGSADSNIDNQGSCKKAKVDNEVSLRGKCRINCGANIVIPGVLRYLVPPIRHCN